MQDFDSKVREEAASHGITVSSVNFTNVSYQWIQTNTYTAYIFPLTPVTIYSEIYHLDMTAEVLSDKPFTQSPMPLWVMKIIQWALQAVVIVLVAYFTIQAIQACVQSLFVKKQTVKIYDANGNLVEEKSGEEPSWTSGIFVIGGLVIAGLILVPLVSELIKSRKKGSRKKGRRK
jgi:hypothetical protein